jgi:hypothetical protein
MAITFIDSVWVYNNDECGPMSVSVGDILIAGVFNYSGGLSDPLTDDAGNTWTHLGDFADADNLTTISVYVTEVTNASATDNFTSSSGSYTAIVVDHFTGLTDTLDGSVSWFGDDLGPDGPISTPPFNTSNANDLIWVVAASNSLGCTWDAGSPLTLVTQGGGYIQSATYIASTTQTGFIAEMIPTNDAQGRVVVAVPLKASGGPPPGPTFRGLPLLGVGL